MDAFHWFLSGTLAGSMLVGSAPAARAQCNSTLLKEPLPIRLNIQRLYYLGAQSSPGSCELAEIGMKVLLDDMDELTLYCRNPSAVDCHMDYANLGDAWTVTWRIINGAGAFVTAKGNLTTTYTGEAVVYRYPGQGLPPALVELTANDQSTDGQHDPLVLDHSCAQKPRVQIPQLLSTPTCPVLTTPPPPPCIDAATAPCHCYANLLSVPSGNDMQITIIDAPDEEEGLCAGELRPVTATGTDTDLVKYKCEGPKCGLHEGTTTIRDYIDYDWLVVTGPISLITPKGMTAIVRGSTKIEDYGALGVARLRLQASNRRPNGQPITGPFLHHSDIVPFIDVPFNVYLVNLLADTNGDGELDPTTDLTQNADDLAESCGQPALLCANRNDSDHDGVADLTDDLIAGNDPDLALVRAAALGTSVAGAFVEITSVPPGRVRFYTAPNKSGGALPAVTPWASWQAFAQQGSVPLYAEGLQGGTVTVTLSLRKGGIVVCQDQLSLSVLDITILNATDPDPVDHVHIARWDSPSAFVGTWQAPAVGPLFSATDPERFVIQVVDPEGGHGVLKLELFLPDQNIDSDAPADAIPNIALTAAGGDVYRTEPRILVTNNDVIDDDFAQLPDVDGVDDAPSDRTLGGFIHGKVKATYTSALHTCSIAVDVCDRTPTDEVKTILLRAHVLTLGGTALVPAAAVRNDIILMNMAWAQCCIRFQLQGPVSVVNPPPAEPFQDVGYDHDQNPTTPPIGAGNGRFSFLDSNMNAFHDDTEACEPFTDSNGNGSYDYPVDLSNGIDLTNQIAQPHGLGLNQETRHLIDSLSDSSTSTIEYIVVPYFTNNPDTRGFSFVNTAPDSTFFQVPNAMMVRATSIGFTTGVPNDFANSAHEAGHILLNQFGHSDGTTLSGRVNLMLGGTDEHDCVTCSKRLTKLQCETAREFH